MVSTRCASYTELSASLASQLPQGEGLASDDPGIRHQPPGILGQGVQEFTLQLWVVAREFDQALFQFAGFFFQSQF